ncbi:minor histocompatibility antigen H13 [Mytilus galloprovincialis]|uniref:Minor histocompatibility antigen H13 n=1 Tax=Mytilus galloprovincialis TaxID=29158 RepID=A0A8B6BPQ2_MYTGA|nr:minor histocompatibility antigen H13 [Mytilus galloprovincialis]
MADSVSEAPVVNITGNDTAANATAKIPATPEGMAVAYGSLLLMAIFPIFVGAFRSVKYHKDQKESGEKPETMTGKDAAMFPVIASCTLFGIYLVFQIFSKDYINLLLTFYFFLLGVMALAHIGTPIISKFIPPSFPNMDYHLIFTQGKEEKKEELLNYMFDRKDIVSLVICGLIGIWYLVKKHWIANNLFGLAFAINGVELLSLNKVSTGCILLGGLFVYDIFWVFGTNVMVTVAKSFEAPIKLVFPQDLLQKGLEANNFAMLGLGDIVIPGIFIALLLRFDISQKKESRTYFYASFAAYFLGLVMTIFVMHFFKHAQPALLYLVPACLGIPIALALLKGEVKAMFNYEDHSEEKTEDEKKEVKEKEEKKKEK